MGAEEDAAAAGALRHPLQGLAEGAAKSAALDPFLSGSGAAADYHSRQESADSGVGLNSTGSLPRTPDNLLTPAADDPMDSADGGSRRRSGEGGGLQTEDGGF